MRSDDPLPLVHALVLGALHGPAELLPVSSSGHVTLVPFLLGWPYGELDPELRKAFEVALHAGTAAALLLVLRDEVGEAARGLDLRRLVLIAGSFAPPGAAGLLLERPIERRLGTPGSIACGLVAGGLVMAAADARGASRRHRDEAGAVDALLLGLAQASALVPGLSRSGMTLSAARLRGFGRADADALSRHVALPVIVGATVLKSARLARRGLPPGMGLRFAAGAGAAFATTLASRPILDPQRALWPYAAYRAALGAAVIRRVRHTAPR